MVQKITHELCGPYLGQEPPGMKPGIFAPGVVSSAVSEGCSGWGNEMEYFVFQRFHEGMSTLFIMNQIDGVWSEPELLTFSAEYRVGDFTVAPDGKTIVFASDKANAEVGPGAEGCSIWTVEKTPDGWTEPRPIGDPINTRYHESYPCLAANGNLYFFSRRPGGCGNSDIYLSEYVDGKYQAPVNLGKNINSEFHEWDPYVAPDESFMILCSTRPSGLGEDDLYVTFRQDDGSWCEIVHMGNEINTADSENRPYTSPDGKYLFFTRVVEGNRNIYWVDAKIIETFR